MIKIVFFDVGGTLVRPQPSVGAIYSDVAKRHGVLSDPEDIDKRFKEVWKLKKATREPIDETWWKSIVGDVFKNHTFKDPESFFRDLYESFEKPSAWFIFPDVHSALAQLQKRGVRMAVASNWDSRLPRLLDDLKLSIYFERQFISFQSGIAKPDPAFFKNALKDMGGNPLEALHVGDDEVEDVRCAELAGMRAYLIDRKTKPINSRMLSSLEELNLRI